MICRSTSIKSALRSRQKGFLLNPFRFGSGNSNTVSLLNFEGANLSTTFADQTGKIWTPFGSARISTDQSKVGSSSGYFDGATSWLSSPYSTDFAFGLGAYRVRLWFRPSSISVYSSIFSTGDHDSQQLSIRVTNSGNVQAYSSNGSINTLLLTGAKTLTAGVWHFIEVYREIIGGSPVTRIFTDGVFDASSTAIYNITNTSTSAWIGVQAFDAIRVAPANGYVDELQVIKGIG